METDETSDNGKTDTNPVPNETISELVDVLKDGAVHFISTFSSLDPKYCKAMRDALMQKEGAKRG